MDINLWSMLMLMYWTRTSISYRKKKTLTC